MLPGKFHEQSSLVGYSPCRCKDSILEKLLSRILREYITII